MKAIINSYHPSIGKKPIDVNYSPLTEEIKRNPKTTKCKVDVRIRITRHNNIFSKGYPENWSK